MGKIAKPNHKKFAVISILFLIIPLFYQGLWIYIFSLYENHADRVEKFRSYSFSSLHSSINDTLVFFIFCLIAVIMSAISLQDSNKFLRIVSMTTLISGSLLSLLLLFQLM
jgi:hypothetical protein